ncbi:MAG: CdvA-like protein [Candidatus Bathyarchaeota archaeon]|nr:CdvA-like protein [Candidatus Bathyarchaeota archaeon]
MISWKYSFKRLNEEYEIALKKKQALDNLFKTGRISEATRNSFENDINAVLIEIEKQQKDLVVKMQGKMQELENQIKTLEMLLANHELQHVIGEIDEESYRREITLLTTGLENAKRELDSIKEAINQLCSPVKSLVTEPLTSETRTPVAENVPIADKTVAQADVDNAEEATPEEPSITTEQTVQEPQSEVVSEETIPTEITQIAENTPHVIVEVPATAKSQPVINEGSLPQTKVVHEVVEETQVKEEIARDLEVTVEEQAVKPEVEEENLQVAEDTQELTEPPLEVTEEVLQVIENSPEIVEEIGEKAHPTKAPLEAHHEDIAENATEQKQDIEEITATADTDEKAENTA